MSKTKLEWMEVSFVSMAEHCMAEAWIECKIDLPDVMIHDLSGYTLNWTVHGHMTGDNLYRLDFSIGEEEVGYVEWAQGVGVNTFDFPNPTEERFFAMAGMALAFQSDVLTQIQ